MTRKVVEVIGPCAPTKAVNIRWVVPTGAKSPCDPSEGHTCGEEGKGGGSNAARAARI